MPANNREQYSGANASDTGGGDFRRDRDTFGDAKLGDDKRARIMRDPDAVPFEDGLHYPADCFANEPVPAPSRRDRVRGSVRMDAGANRKD